MRYIKVRRSPWLSERKNVQGIRLIFSRISQFSKINVEWIVYERPRGYVTPSGMGNIGAKI